MNERTTREREGTVATAKRRTEKADTQSKLEVAGGSHTTWNGGSSSKMQAYKRALHLLHVHREDERKRNRTKHCNSNEAAARSREDAEKQQKM